MFVLGVLFATFTISQCHFRLPDCLDPNMARINGNMPCGIKKMLFAIHRPREDPTIGESVRSTWQLFECSLDIFS
jgi:hypothetical protein